MSKRQYVMVQHILQCGPNINLQTMDKDTALHIACERDDVDMILLLLKAKDIDINVKNAAGVHFLLNLPPMMPYETKQSQIRLRVC